VNQIEIPSGSGSYRWYYVDVTSGDFTAVFIFMIGSVFSARYSTSLKRGGVPREHAAVNFALYEKGVRTLWALTEYGDLALSADARSLHIGRSQLRYTGNGLEAQIRDKTAPFLVTQWGTPLEVQLELANIGPSLDEVRLVEGRSHFWRPIAPRAWATVRIKGLGLKLEGRAYHDGNHGLVPLGTDLRGWEWVRRHDADSTGIVYRPWTDSPAIIASISSTGSSLRREHLPAPPSERSSWGLKVPSSLGVSARPMLMESSPFYARAEASADGVHALGEVADFARFHAPSVRWMATWRTRAGGAA
jgi:carotenoid 1,2-hydratase